MEDTQSKEGAAEEAKHDEEIEDKAYSFLKTHKVHFSTWPSIMMLYVVIKFLYKCISHQTRPLIYHYFELPHLETHPPSKGEIEIFKKYFISYSRA